jgi:polyhydroxyalkanoate synthesis regulator phasin
VDKLENSSNLFDEIKMEQNSTLKNNLKMNNVKIQNLKGKIDVRETAQYISDMMLELRNMAKSAELKTLQGLLEVSFYEAFTVANKVDISDEEIEHLRELSRASTS